MSDQIRESVFQLVAVAGVSFVAEYRGEKKNALNGNSPMDQGLCVFTSDSRPNEPEEFDYFTGLGLRAEATPRQKQTAAFSFPGLMQNDIDRRTIWGRRYLAEVEKQRKPIAPHVADVLHCLLRDSDAVGQSFDSWCDELGYGNDSRKAYATYEACQKTGDRLRRLFTHAQREELQTTLQDY